VADQKNSEAYEFIEEISEKGLDLSYQIFVLSLQFLLNLIYLNASIYEANIQAVIPDCPPSLLLFSASAGYAAVRFTIASGIHANHFPERSDALFGNRIIHPLSLSAAVYKPAVSQNFHVMRKRRLTDLQSGQQIAAAHFAMLKNKHDGKTVFIRQSLYFSGIFPASHIIHSVHHNDIIALTFIFVNVLQEYSDASPPDMQSVVENS
jgi:hypothetical protein